MFVFSKFSYFVVKLKLVYFYDFYDFEFCGDTGIDVDSDVEKFVRFFCGLFRY